MAVLPDIGREPDYGLGETPTFRVRQVQLGDGYHVRQPDGLNTVTRTWEPAWTGLDRDQAENLMNFFKHQRGVYGFEWTNFHTGELVRVYCPECASAESGPNSFSVNAVFIEDFNLV